MTDSDDDKEKPTIVDLREHREKKKKEKKGKKGESESSSEKTLKFEDVTPEMFEKFIPEIERRAQENYERNEKFKESFRYNLGEFIENPLFITYMTYRGVREQGDLLSKLGGVISWPDEEIYFVKSTINSVTSFINDYIIRLINFTNSEKIEPFTIFDVDKVYSNDKFLTFYEDFSNFSDLGNDLSVLFLTTATCMYFGENLKDIELFEKLKSKYDFVREKGSPMVKSVGKSLVDRLKDSSFSPKEKLKSLFPYRVRIEKVKKSSEAPIKEETEVSEGSGSYSPHFYNLSELKYRRIDCWGNENLKVYVKQRGKEIFIDYLLSKKEKKGESE